MKKYLCAAASLLLAATMLFGCGNQNVSDHPNGKITDPTVAAPTIIPEPTIMTDTTHPTSSAKESSHPTSEPPRTTEPSAQTDLNGTTGTEPSTEPHAASRAGRGF